MDNITAVRPVTAALRAQAHSTPPGQTPEAVPDARPSSLNVTSVRTSSQSEGTRIVLSVEPAEAGFGSDTFLVWSARALADSVVIAASSGASDSPSFRSRVLALQSQVASPPPSIQLDPGEEIADEAVAKAEAAATAAAAAEETADKADTEEATDSAIRDLPPPPTGHSAPVAVPASAQPTSAGGAETRPAAAGATEAAYHETAQIMSPPTGGAVLQHVYS